MFIFMNSTTCQETSLLVTAGLAIHSFDNFPEKKLSDAAMTGGRVDDDRAAMVTTILSV